MNGIVVRLYPRLASAARRLNNTTSRVVDNDDLTQAMAVALLEHTYLNVDGYCVRFAKHRAVDRLRADSTYRRYVCPMPQVLGEDGDMLNFDDFMPARGRSPEEELIAREEREELLRRLTPSQNRVLALLAGGYTKSEIAEKLGVSRPRISQHAARIQAAINTEAMR